MIISSAPSASLKELLLQFRPDESIAWEKAKEALMEAARYDDANERAVASLLGTTQNNVVGATAWKEVGRVFNRSGQFLLSQKAYYKAYDLSEEDSELIGGLVYTFRQLREYEKAIALYSARLIENENDLSAIEKLGNMHYETGNFSKATAYYKQFLLHRPSDSGKQKLLYESQRIVDSALSRLATTIAPLAPDDRRRIEECFFAAKRENSVSPSSWPTIVNALVLAAAITSALADAPNAAKNIKDAVEYVFGAHAETPTQPLQSIR